MVSHRSIRTGLLLLLAARLLYSVLSPSGAQWDFAQYYRTGSRAWHGEWSDLYRTDAAAMNRFLVLIGERELELPPADPVEPRPMVPSGRLGHVGAPLSALALAPLGALPRRQALVAFKFVGAVCFVFAWWLIFPAFRDAASHRIAADRILPLYLALCLLFEPFWFVFTAGGQSTPFNLLMLALFYRLFVENRVLPAALAFAAGIWLKPFFVLSFVVLLLARRWRLLSYLAALLALGGLASLAIFGLGLHLEWLAVVRVSADGLAEPWWNNSSVLGALYTLWCVSEGAGLEPAGEPHGWVRWLAAAYKIGVVLLFAYLSRAPVARVADARSQRHYVALLAVIFPLFISNIVWPHYLSFLFLPLLFLLVSAGPRAVPTVLAWAIFVSTLAIRGRAVQRYLLSFLEELPWLQGAAAGLAGSAPVLLLLILVVSFRRNLTTLLGATPR